MKHLYLKSIILAIFSLIGMNAFASICEVNGIYFNSDETSKIESIQQPKPKQVLPGIFKSEKIQFQKRFKMDGKNYTLYFLDPAKDVRSKKYIVSLIFLVPDDFSLIRKQGENKNYPPMLKKFIYHDLGDPENKDYCTAQIVETLCDKNGENSKYIEREFRLPDEVANNIISLFSGETNLRVIDRMLSMYAEEKGESVVNQQGESKTLSTRAQAYDLETDIMLSLYGEEKGEPVVNQQGESKTLSTRAQAYDFVCKEKETGFWYCDLKYSIDLQDDLKITFGLVGHKDYLWKIDWHIYDKRKSGKQFSDDAGINENSQVVVYLENGLNFTFRECLSLPYFGSFEYITETVDLMNGKKFFLNDSQRQTFAMSLLRLYNITKVSFDGKTINTPNMRSAETFNAMCKALEEKTDDQWSYGKEIMEKSEIEDIVEIFLKTKP